MTEQTAFYNEATAYFDRDDVNGNPTGLRKILGSSGVEIKANSNMLEQQSKDKGTHGMVVAAVSERKPSDFSWSIQRFTKESLAMALLGDSSAITITGGTATDEMVTAKLGIFVPLANAHLTAGSVVVTNSAASTTYVEGVDYEINYALGWIEAIAGGEITDALSLKVDYLHGAATGWKVNGETVTQIKGRFVLDGRNLVDGKGWVFTVPKCMFSSEAALDFLSDKFSEFKFKGRPILGVGQTVPYTMEYFD
jgi:hypothetical protein